MTQTTVKHTAFTAKDADSKPYQWSFWRLDGIWYLRDHTGYTRTLERNWRDSVGRVQRILENHGFTADIS